MKAAHDSGSPPLREDRVRTKRLALLGLLLLSIAQLVHYHGFALITTSSSSRPGPPRGYMALSTSSAPGGGKAHHKGEGRRDTVVVAMADYPSASDYWSSPFVWSLRCTGYRGAIVLIVSEHMHERPPDELAAFFRDMGVTTLARSAPPEGCPEGGEGPIDVRCLGPEFGRYVEYERVLQGQPRGARVLLQDFRDTIFQADPFGPPWDDEAEAEAEADLMVFSEFPLEPLGPSFWTTMWVATCFGEGAARLLHGQPVLCSGSVMGTREAVQHYLSRMVAAMSVLGGREECRALGLDQGFHNYLFYTGAFNQQQQAAAGGVALVVKEAGRSQVHTIGRFCSGPEGHEVNHTYIADRAGGFMVLNDGPPSLRQPAPVVHQIDRCKLPFYDQGVHEDFILRHRCPPEVAFAVARAQGRPWEGREESGAAAVASSA